MFTIKDPSELGSANELTALEEHNRLHRVKRDLLLELIASARSRGDHTGSDPFTDFYDPTTGLPR